MAHTHPALAGALTDTVTAELTVLAGFDQALVVDATRAPPTVSVACSPAFTRPLYRPGTPGGFTPGTALTLGAQRHSAKQKHQYTVPKARAGVASCPSVVVTVLLVVLAFVLLTLAARAGRSPGGRRHAAGWR